MDATQLLDRLALRLWDDRHLMTVLAYELTVARLLLTRGDDRFVADALREVEHTVELVRASEEAGDEAVRDLAAACRVDPDDLSLGRLARTAAPPFDHVFADHLAAFRTLAAEIRDAAQEHPTLARCDLGAVTERLARLTGMDLSLETERSRIEGPDVDQGVIDLRIPQVAHEAILREIGRTPPPSLVAFLS